MPKPDSPCIYLEDNNGPDGCAIFFKSDQFVLWSNLQEKSTGKQITVATTHLKARQGKLLSTLRNEQGKDMLDWLHDQSEGRPLLLSGDFNADPTEPVYQTVVSHRLGMESAYKYDQESPTPEDYTTWKIRETGEQKYVLDYIFHSQAMTPLRVLDMPTVEEIGKERLPSLKFPSDHLSLVADFRFA